MKRSPFLIAASMLLTFKAHAASLSPSFPNELVPKNLNVIESIRGDLNKDGLEDIVLLVKATEKSKHIKNEHGQSVDRNRRGLIIAFNNGKTFKLALANTHCFSSENEDGGVYFPPELSITAKKGSLFIDFHHGRYGHWSYNFQFRQGDMELIGYDSSSNNGPVVESFTSINLVSNKILKKINTNQKAEGGDERFKETWSKLKPTKPIKLSAIVDFDDFYVEKALGLLETP